MARFPRPNTGFGPLYTKSWIQDFTCCKKSFIFESRKLSTEFKNEQYAR